MMINPNAKTIIKEPALLYAAALLSALFSRSLLSTRFRPANEDGATCVELIKSYYNKITFGCFAMKIYSLLFTAQIVLSSFLGMRKMISDGF